MFNKKIESKALQLAAFAGTADIESVSEKIIDEKKTSCLVACLYTEFMDSFWHYIAHYYGKEEST